jgi:3alpha(or 20beta)-hydroxysteroid dehydrogenase
VAALLAARKRLDVLVLNAGTWKGGRLAETSDADWDLLIGLNLRGAFLPLRAAIPAMQAAKRGTIVGIGALGGLVGMPGSGAYAASKWGMRGLLASAALELNEYGIRVSHVHPQNINSAGRDIAADSPERLKNLEPAEVAALVAFIATAPAHVRVGDATIWPIASGIGPR